MVNAPPLIAGIVLFICYSFVMVGTATDNWRKELDGVSYFDRNYGLWNMCTNGFCIELEDYLLPGETEDAMEAARAFAILAVIFGIIASPCYCAAGLAGKCFCLTGAALGAVAFLCVFFMQIFAIIAFAIFVGKVEDQIETDSKIWEYSWSFALFTTGWTVACCCGPTSKTVGDEDN
eukprot:CAMPEP_0201489892 /NCGR_PEP_ID=MMETSP0151_2-20130828/24074_1 /ASSEMBLY_ACC=CAM_ASM_000257 /TAXON_ID=200890 /ORGANISM="Paramoeba atlantica, Strain 621/1 / CCAP 1560/9" /LENGTH=176 /DNA_ID=CAMNT_0047875623 /DNA_START=40 /DNA_END=570 /DNA_ORIENTATION=+